MNVNAIILEIPLAFITKSPEQDRIVNTWGESWVLKGGRQDRDDSRSSVLAGASVALIERSSSTMS